MVSTEQRVEQALSLLQGLTLTPLDLITQLQNCNTIEEAS